MRMPRRDWALSCSALFASACFASKPPPRVLLPPPEQSTALGPGDEFTLEIMGEKDAPTKFVVASDGTVDLPYKLFDIKVTGLEPQELARLVRRLLTERDMLIEPTVVVLVTQYRSKQISILGQVQRPGSFAYQPGMTLMQAISMAGGLNAIAQRRVRLTRRLKPRGTRTVVFDFDALNAGEQDDPALQDGDRIYIEERVF